MNDLGSSGSSKTIVLPENYDALLTCSLSADCTFTMPSEVRDETGVIIGMNQSERLTPLVPENVSARQIRLWLIQHGISLSQVDAAIDSIPDQLQRDLVRVEWNYAPYVERSHPMLIPLAAYLGLTEEQVDQAFIEASLL
jgi:hypothetical protein